MVILLFGVNRGITDFSVSRIRHSKRIRQNVPAEAVLRGHVVAVYDPAKRKRSPMSCCRRFDETFFSQILKRENHSAIRSGTALGFEFRDDLMSLARDAAQIT